MSAATQPESFEVRTRDRDVGAAAVRRIVAHRARITFEDPDRVDLRVRMSHRGEFGAFRLRLGGVRYVAATEPVGFLFAGFVTAGWAAVRTRGQDVIVQRNDGWMFPLDVPFSGEAGDATLGLLGVPVAYAAALAESATGLPAGQLRFVAPRPVSEPMRRYWVGTAAYLASQLTTPGAESPPLVAAELLRVAASAFLRVFPNTTMTAARLPAGGRADPAVVRRATAFMDGHSDQPLTVAEVAAAVGVGARGLQSAFRRHHDTTPLGYLRQIRLDRVHCELQVADPASGVTVRETARRWGFAHPGRFAAEYRAAFGRPPSQTLRA
jgi:AraC-like DNA-binding protein